MNRSWITALTLATVAGSGSAFAGVVASTSDATPAAAQSPASFNETAFVRVEPQTPATTAVSYQVGAAGSTTLSIANGTLVIDNASPGTGWGITSASSPGTHIDVQFTDGTQLVTFGADLIGSDIAVTVTNALAVPVTTAAPAQAVTVDSTATTDAANTTIAAPAPQPATPAAEAPAAPRPVAVATTTAPSGSGDDGGNDDHETEYDDD